MRSGVGAKDTTFYYFLNFTKQKTGSFRLELLVSMDWFFIF